MTNKIYLGPNNGRKIWVDDVRPMPEGYDKWCKTTNEAIQYLWNLGVAFIPIDLLDMDHDAGDYAWDGGDYIKILDWYESMLSTYPRPRIKAFHFHSMNPVGIQNMRAIIQKYGWEEI